MKIKKALSFFLCLILSFSLILILLECSKKDENKNKNTESDKKDNQLVKIEYPATKIESVKETLHNVEITDPYRWLEDSENEDVKKWTEEQNKLSKGYIHKIKSRENIKKRITDLWNFPKMSLPHKKGEYYFYTHNDGLQDQSILYVKKGLDGEAKVVIDPNTLSEDKTKSLDYWYPSKDGKLMIYGLSDHGSEKSTLFIKDIETGKDLKDTIKYCYHTGVAWNEDGTGFYYTRNPATGTVSPDEEFYYEKLFYHKIGDDPKNDKLIMENKEQKEVGFWPRLSFDYKYLIVHSYFGSSRKNTIFFKDLTKENSEFIQLINEFKNDYNAFIHDDKMYIKTNEDSPNFKIMVTDVKNPKKENWKVLIPESKDLLNGISFIKGNLVLKYLHNAYTQIKVYDLDGKFKHEIKFPTVGSIGGPSAEWNNDELFFSFTSFTFPSVIYRYTFESNKLNEYFTTNLDINVDGYEAKQIWYESKDKTKVSMFIVHKKGIKLDGNNPTLLYGYGGFSANITPRFSATRFVWLEKDGIFALANLRGGGEYGEKWHKDGMLDKKQNTFDDFISAAEYLIKEKYTSKDKLGIIGGSNGGLLIGAVITQRPDLFKASACLVPLLDMVRYDKFLMAKFWVPEYGTAEDPEQFKFIYDYSPYHNVKEDVDYPATYITTAESDSRVHPLHARKMAAKLQKAQKSDNPILLYVESKAGHGPGKPISKSIEDVTDLYTFLGYEVGMWD